MQLFYLHVHIEMHEKSVIPNIHFNKVDVLLELTVVVVILLFKLNRKKSRVTEYLLDSKLNFVTYIPLKTVAGRFAVLY